MSQNTITYEQPLNEHIRLCLRLEHLFKQLQEHITTPTVSASQTAMTALLKILNVADRPDLKSKLAQSLTQQASILAQLERSEQVDHEKLQEILHQLDQASDQLHQLQGKIGDSLRNNHFLNQIRLHLSHPAGPCGFSTPAYALWLEKPDEKRINDLLTWVKELRQLDTITRLILRLSRESAPTKNVIGNQGFYQQSLDTQYPCQMVRVTVPLSRNSYPEISVGKHRLVIRFLSLHSDTPGQPQQLQDDITFDLSCCRV